MLVLELEKISVGTELMILFPYTVILFLHFTDTMPRHDFTDASLGNLQLIGMWDVSANS